MGAPDQVELVVPRVDVEHRADSCDVVLVAVCIFDVLVADGHLGEQSEAPGRALAQFLCGVEAVHQQRPSPGPLVFETVKNLNAAAGTRGQNQSQNHCCHTAKGGWGCEAV